MNCNMYTNNCSHFPPFFFPMSYLYCAEVFFVYSLYVLLNRVRYKLWQHVHLIVSEHINRVLHNVLEERVYFYFFLIPRCRIIEKKSIAHLLEDLFICLFYFILFSLENQNKNHTPHWWLFVFSCPVSLSLQNVTATFRYYSDVTSSVLSTISTIVIITHFEF